MVKKIEAPAGDDPDKVESLTDLAREFQQEQQAGQAAADSASQAQQQAEAQQRQQSASAAVEQVTMVLLVARNIAAEIAHELDKLPRDVSLSIWTDERMRTIAAPAGAIAEEYADVLDAFFRKWGPLLMLGASLAMPTVATIKAVRAHKPLNTTAREVPSGEGATGG